MEIRAVAAKRTELEKIAEVENFEMDPTQSSEESTSRESKESNTHTASTTIQCEKMVDFDRY